MPVRGALGGPRLLLRRLREIMALPVGPQERLDRIVVLIAGNMVAEVCSVYVLRGDGVLELFATEGLNRAAVHQTKLQPGEGLVGLIAETAEPLALTDAQKHPRFSYRPETGEEIYNTFLGVPLLRAGHTVGVLVVQNRARRVYPDEEVEALQTTAMVLAEMLGAADLEALSRETPVAIAVRKPMALAGVSVADGVGLGRVVLHEPRVTVTNLVADDPEAEARRLESGLVALRETLDELIETSATGPGEHRDILETFRRFADDRGWLRRLREAVAQGLTAEAAVERVQSDTRARMLRQTDPYIKERLHDLDELANRLLHVLTGAAYTRGPESLPENAILVARAMGPAALLDYDRARLRGLVLEEGGPTSHVAVVARALGIPTVGEVEGITTLVEPGDPIIVDGDGGQVQLRPQPDVEAAYADKARLRARRQEQYRALRDRPCITRDGVRIDLLMNAGLLVDMPNLEACGASGIGLFRTEILFMVTPTMPRGDAQEALYRAVLHSAGGRPVTFRTLDIGGDKVLPYMRKLEEENPALGWRAVRIGLDRPALLRTQLRALLKANAGRVARIMVPMVGAVAEIRAVRDLLEREVAHLRRHGHATPREIKLGVMLEVPALLFDLDALADHADFVSVGSNDLMQFLFAADRDNRRVAKRFDSLSPPMLRALRDIARRLDDKRVPYTLCGEMAGGTLEAVALAALGYRALSMGPDKVGPVKAALLGTDVAEARRVLDALIDDADACGNLRAAFQAWAEGAGIPL